METLELTLPTFLYSALIYGEEEMYDFSDEDHDAFNKLTDYLDENEYYQSPIDHTEEGFTHFSHDAENVCGYSLGGDYSTFTFAKINK